MPEVREDDGSPGGPRWDGSEGVRSVVRLTVRVSGSVGRECWFTLSARLGAWAHLLHSIMALAGSPYPFAKSTGRCAATGQEFAEGASYVATLCERESSPGMERLDFSLAAWEGGARPALPL